MNIIHNFGKFNSINQTARGDDISLMLSGGGSYLWMGENSNSRYQGAFFEFNGELIKIVDNILPRGGGKVLALENYFWQAKRVRAKNEETFFLGGDFLIYEIKKLAPIEIILDIKKIYHNPEFGRHYLVWQKDDLLMASYRQDGDFCVRELFLAIAGDFSKTEIKNQWILRKYSLDKKRASPPFQRWVFSPASIFASKLAIAAGIDREKTMARAREVWREREQLKKQRRQSIATPKKLFLFADKKTRCVAAAKNSAKNSLASLLVCRGGELFLRAGLPWFFQIWQRDEAVSLPGLAHFDQSAAEKIFWHQIDELKKNNYHFDTADGVGWLFFAAAEFLRQNRFNGEEKGEIFDCLKKAIDYSLENNTASGLAVNDDGEKTWMDSLNRAGAAIEIQAMRLNMYALAVKLATNIKQKAYYLKLRNDLAKSARAHFFDGKRAADIFNPKTGIADFVCRPNIFLAAHIFRETFSSAEWQAIFDWALPKLWLDWGGLATISKDDLRFCADDTGENPASYHNGDSWFWINNLAAIVLAQTNYRKYETFVEKIFEASQNDILWRGAVGYPSEISSAREFCSAGCPNQSWSAATFLELCRELKK